MIDTKQLLGKKFGKLTVIERAGSDSQGHRAWLCKCDCGNDAIVTGSNLIRGKPHHTVSCGCESSAINEVGNKYGGLTVVEDRGSKKDDYGVYQRWWLCLCDCGNEVEVVGNQLRAGSRVRCGSDCPLPIGYKSKTKRYGECAFNTLVSRTKRNAKKRNKFFNLTDEQIKDICTSNCYYCGSEPRQVVRGTLRGGDFIYNGIDRVDNSRGYEIENVVPCCIMCNKAKNNNDVDEFKNWICQVYENWASK